MAEIDVRGRFVWHQLLTRDIPGAKTFYSRVVNWKAQAWPLDPNYTVCQAGDVPTAGMMPFTPEVPADAPPHWLQYIGTRDVDGTAEAAVRAGGSILKDPSDMRGAGRYAVLKDPQGAIFAIIDPENARAEAPGVPPLGQFTWHELATTDHEAAFAFYASLFGWDAMQRMDMGPMGIYLIFGYNGEQKGGIYIKPADMPAPPNWLPYLHVANVDAAVPVVEANGGKIILAPMEVPGGSRITVIMDSTGAAFALNSYPTAAAAPGADSSSAAAPKAKPKSKKAKAAKRKARVKPKARAKVPPKAKVPARKKAPKKSKSRVKPKARPKSKARAKPKKKVARRKK
jgi:predicted enzyme related to lactoylglutathione lyase